jgi:hypothetical protein
LHCIHEEIEIRKNSGNACCRAVENVLSCPLLTKERSLNYTAAAAIVVVVVVVVVRWRQKLKYRV